MSRIEVHKFGGTSLAGGDRMAAAAALLRPVLAESGLVVVASAMAGVTDDLESLADLAARGDLEQAIALLRGLQDRHHDVTNGIDPGAADLYSELDRSFERLEELVRAVVSLGELTPAARDRILATGEKLSARILCLALARAGIEAVPVDADTFLRTDGNHGRAEPLAAVSEQTISASLGPLLKAGVVPVVTGYCGRAPDGSTTTLGRGGSDLSATLIGAALDADEVVIWTDVDGAFSADPRVVPEARLIGQLNYREATELSYYGAKVLHPRTIIPVARKRIPVRIRNTFVPSSFGTVVDGRFTPGSHPVKAISAIRGQTLVSLDGKGMAGVPGIAARLFAALAKRKISVTMISQSSSEATICIAVPASQAWDAEMALKREFRMDMSQDTVEEVAVRRGIGLIAVVGLGMAQTPGVSGRVFQALGEARVNILAIAQGSSELNISMAVEEQDLEHAIRAIHSGFGLHRADTGIDASSGFDMILLGCGQVGRMLVELVLKRRAHVFDRFGLRARIVAISDRSGYLFEPTGIAADRLASALKAKACGARLAGRPDATATRSSLEAVRHALSYRLARPVLVDVSDSDESLGVFLEAFDLGCDVVTANKKPLAGPLDDYARLLDGAARAGRLLKMEATVGAGLPVIDTLEMLLATGDRLIRARGCLSGTLGFLLARLEEDVPFSEAVREAVEAGYTEPDPVVDLSGTDVGRKAIILGRLSGLVGADVPVALTGLVDAGLAGLPRNELLEALKRYDAPYRERVAGARAAGNVLRYVAEVSEGIIRVGLNEVPKSSPIGGLEGADNMIVIESERYRTRPLVVTGPGAGIEVTAMGVFGDILRVAAERK